MPKAQVDKAFKEFISHNPESQYTFDSERGSSISELCRQNGKSNPDCITLQMNAKRLFEAMQDQGFFCSLPMDPGRTYMECKPLPK